MSQQPPKPVYDFGGAPAIAPSVPRVDVSGWLLASGALGLAAGTVALNLLWRPLPGLEGPPGALSFHAAQGARWAAHWLFPNLFAGDAKSYAAALAKLADRERLALAWRGCAGLVAACAPAVLLARGCLAPRDGLIALRGARRYEGAEAAERLRAEMAPRAKARPDHPIAPGLPYPADMWTRHVLVVAGTGSGKSTFLRPLIAATIGAGESLLLFDPKGEFTKGFGGIEILAPWDERSLAWDIAKDMRNIGDMRRFAATMVREAQDPMWSNAARQLMVGFMIYLNETRGRDWGWRELAEMVSTPQQNILPIMSEYHPEAIRAVERASVTTQGILINLASFSASIFDLAEAWGDAPPERRVSFVEWAQQRGRHRQLILQGHGAYPELAKSYLEGVVGTVSAIVNSVEMDDDENRKLWLIADEAGQMGKMPIRALLELGRSRGMRCVLACQDLAQLEEIYGAPMVKAMSAMVGTILVGQMMPGDTAEQLCKTLGAREVERLNFSSSRNGAGHAASSTTLSFSRDELSIYKPAELASRLGPTRDGKGVKFALLAGGNAYELFWPHYKMARVRPAHVPAAWTRGGARDDRRDGVAVSNGGAGRSGLGSAAGDAAAGGGSDPSLSIESDVGQRFGSAALDGAESTGAAGAMDHAESEARTRAGRDAELRLRAAGASAGSLAPKVDQSTMAALPTAADVQRLLRQSVEVRALPVASRASHAPASTAAGKPAPAAHGFDAKGSEARAATPMRDGVAARGEAGHVVGDVVGHGVGHGREAASRPDVPPQPHFQDAANAGTSLRLEAERKLGAGSKLAGEVSEAVAEAVGERVGRAPGAEAGALVAHAAEVLDALRPKAGPIQVVAVAQRPPSDELEHQRKAKPKAEPRAKADPAPTRT